jgi:carboxylate-amine ligase
MAADDFTIGVEEEFQIVDPTSRQLDPSVDEILAEARRRTAPEQVSHELQQTQIEIGTPICRSLDDVRGELRRLRSEVAAAASARGLAIAAAGSHPFVRPDEERITHKDSYLALADLYAHLASEQKVFGCHVHVGVADRELAIATMNHIRPWLATILALSSSSPFWAGVDTRYASYRTEVFGRWPTAGPTELFSSAAEFDDVVEQLLGTGSIDDRARIYWDVRPSAKFATLELRVADVCTSLDDAVMIAGLAGGLVRYGAARAAAGHPPAPVRPEVLRAARWRAARYGTSADLVDVGAMRAAPAAEVVERLLTVIGPALDEWGEREHVTDLVRQVLARGTSAERQREVYRRRGSLDDVVDWLLTETNP